MKITFLGTGTSQGVPVMACDCAVCHSLDYRDKRLRTSVHIDLDGFSLVIDVGPDFRQQILTNGIPRLDAVLFTHEHRDHTAGLDEVRSFNFAQDMDIPVYGEERVLNYLQEAFAYIFASFNYPGIPRIELNKITESSFELGGVEIIPIRALHYKLPVLGYRIGDFAYITDANKIEPNELAKLKNLKVLVLNALQYEPHISHFTVNEALEIADQLQPDQTYFTHMSHSVGFHSAVSDKLPEGVELAHDGLQISL